MLIKHLKDEIKLIQDRIETIQLACTHPKEVLISIPGANTGNYDPHDDQYWINHYCQLCEKRWVEQS